MRHFNTDRRSSRRQQRAKLKLRLRQSASPVHPTYWRTCREAGGESSVRDFVGSTENTTAAFDLLDRSFSDGRSSSGNGLVSIVEILNFRAGTDIPLDDFLNSVDREMRFDLVSPEEQTATGVSLSGLQGNAGELFGFDALCSLTQLYVSEPGVANHLCATLMASKNAAAQGQAQNAARFLTDYINDVEAQVHRTLTRRKGKTLTDISIVIRNTASSPGI